VSAEQARGNAGAAGWQLTDEELNEVGSIVKSPN
jgi:aryl-alcohol dehydrogenase-like predicted oxidoreductase